jgi:hypothetical protein
VKTKISHIGVLTGGGDCPGLNAVIRAVTKCAILEYGLEVVGFMNGFRGLVENDYMPLDLKTVSGISHTGTLPPTLSFTTENNFNFSSGFRTGDSPVVPHTTSASDPWSHKYSANWAALR